MEVDLGEALDDPVEEVGVVEAVDLVEESEAFDDGSCVRVRSRRCRSLKALAMLVGSARRFSKSKRDVL